MTINYILNTMFSKDNISKHCRDLKSKAYVKLNTGGLGDVHSKSITDIKIISVNKKIVVGLDTEDATANNQNTDIACLVMADTPDKEMTVEEVIDALHKIDNNLELCAIDKEYKQGWILSIIGIFDESIDNRIVTNFCV